MIDKLKELLAEFVDVNNVEINEGTALSTDLGLSSLDYFELVNRLEEEFAIEISDTELYELHTVGDIINCINSKK